MNIAIIPSQGLGDGFIQLLLAQNLTKLGVDIDYYHQNLFDIRHLINKVTVCDFKDGSFEKRLLSYDLVLADSGARAVNLSSSLNSINHRLARYSMARVAMYSIRRRRSLYNPDFIAPLYKYDDIDVDFNCFNGQTLSSDRFSGYNTASHICHFFKKNKLLPSPDYDLSISIPDNWVRKKYFKRIIVHPTSSNEKKNWLPDRYLQLARLLKGDGFTPVFSVSPSEKPKWVALIESEFEMPVFTDIFDLAKYYYQSAILVGNDSGNGHLASAFGLPTVTVIGRKYKNFTWRPSWGENIIIKPMLSRKLIGDSNWKYTIAPQRVFKIVKQVLECRQSRPIDLSP